MSQSKRKTMNDEPISESQIHEVLEHWGVPSSDLNFAVNDDPDDMPYLVFDQEISVGIEAHLFTIADMVLWVPELLPSGSVVVYYPLYRTGDRLIQLRTTAWDLLMRHLDYVMHKVRNSRRKHGEPSESWAHNEREEEGYFEIPENEPVPIDRILRMVDPSIKEPILALNRSGFSTVSSCSGLKKDHEGKNPFNTYVVCDDEYYLDVSAHLFTLAEAAGWDPGFGAHGFDVFLHTREYGEKTTEKAWDRLAVTAIEFGKYLENYRDLVEPWRGYLYYEVRKQRGLFSSHYSDGELSMSGFMHTLNEIEKRFEQ